jgi:hypothetical protein
MKKLKEILKTNSSLSSKLDICLGNSLYGDLSPEKIKDENVQEFQNLRGEMQ